MFVCFQFPLTDIRQLLEESTFRLSKPFWPMPDLNQMVRYFGPVLRRPNGGIHSWSDEAVICQARRALRLPNQGKSKINVKGLGDVLFRITSRRFNADGKIMGKYEFGVKFEDLLDRYEPRQQAYNLKVILSSFAQLLVKVPKISAEPIPLYKAGKSLGALYLRASTQMKELGNDTIRQRWVQAGEPIMVVEYNDQELTEIPDGAKVIENSRFKQMGVTLSYYPTPIDQGSLIRTWLIGRSQDRLKDKETKEFLRGLRTNLFRINAEKEAIRQVLNYIRSNKNRVQSELKLYQLLGLRLEKISTKLLKKERYDINQSDILEYALQSVEEVSPGGIEQLNDSFKEALENIVPLNNPFIQRNLGKLKEMGGVQIFYGDNYENVIDSTIINRSNVKKSFNGR